VLRERLLRLYPRAWRDRYGEEFLAMAETAPIRPREVVDIVSGAIDAWLSSEVRRMTMASGVARPGGGPMTLKALLACERKATGVTPRDGLIGAAVMLAVSWLLATAAVYAKQEGLMDLGAFLGGLAFPVSLTISMPFWLMRGAPRAAQAAIVGTTLVLLVTIGLFRFN
jgi:hypothetical protein